MKQYLALIAGATLSISNSATTLGAEQPMAVGTRLIEVLPAPVYHLFAWPGDEVLQGPKRVQDDSSDVAYPKKNARAWIEKVLAPDWLPASSLSLICMRKEFDDRDVVRVQWTTNGYNIQVAQTASILTLKLIPIGETTGPGTNNIAGKTRDFMTRLFAPSAQRRDSQGEVLQIAGFNEKIAASAVHAEAIRTLAADGATVSGPAFQDAENAESPSAGAPAGDWFASDEARGHWFRRINWWTDGTTTGVFFLKAEGGAWVPSYAGNIDVNWFRGPRDRLGRPLK